MSTPLRLFVLLSLLLGVSSNKNCRANRNPPRFMTCNKRDLCSRKPYGHVPQNLSNLPKSSLKKCLLVDETVGFNSGVENKLWYFREDLLMNAGHVFWHLTNPHNLNNPEWCKEEPENIDRRGELFYYFHRNILARYEAERISNSLSPVTPLQYEEGASIKLGYKPHHLRGPTHYRYPQRYKNMRLDKITESIEVWHLLQDDIDSRTLVGKDGSFYNLGNKKGIDLLGDTIEASSKSVNDERYTSCGIHAHGHINIGRLHEDIGDNELVCSPIYNPSTAMRDPVFYQWHKITDDLFRRHKNLLKPNHPTEGEFPLLWSGVKVQNIFVKSVVYPVGRRPRPYPRNSLRTFFKTLKMEIPLTKDIFFSNVTYEYCIKRLDHDEFTYNIEIKKQPFVTSNKAFVRIFMAPRFNFRGQKYTLEKQIPSFFPMDSFVTELDGDITVVSRSSSDSTLLSNWKLENWQKNPPVDYSAECGCGWPSHLLLPKGKPGAGMIFDLFIMVTDATIDVPVQDPLEQDPICPMRHILCGKQDQKYPDLRPMGYPFDTKPFSISTSEGTRRMVASLEEYVSLIPNSNTVQIVITHDR